MKRRWERKRRWRIERRGEEWGRGYGIEEEEHEEEGGGQGGGGWGRWHRSRQQAGREEVDRNMQHLGILAQREVYC